LAPCRALLCARGHIRAVLVSFVPHCLSVTPSCVSGCSCDPEFRPRKVAMPEPVNRTILLLDIERFSRRDDVVQAVLRRSLSSVVDNTLTEAGVERTQHYREDRGDGLIVLINGDVPKAVVLRALLTHTPELLHEYNRLAAQGAQMRLRMVLAAGEVADDPQAGTTGGLVGHDLNQAFRLLDSDELRKALSERSAEECVLCVSDAVYQGVVRHGPRGVRAESFQRIEVTSKNGVAPAWLHGAAAQRTMAEPASGETAASAMAQPRQDTQPRQEEAPAGAVFHFHGAPTVHGSLVGGDQHGVSGGRVDGDVVLGSAKSAPDPCRSDVGESSDGGKA
jgi:hypothetical protein